MKKILMGLVLSLMMAANIFAVDLVKYATYETERLGTINVYFDYDATEPFDIENESIKHFLYLQEIYGDDVEVCLENIIDWWPWLCSETIANNCYRIFTECGYGCADAYIHDDGTVTVYTYPSLK